MAKARIAWIVVPIVVGAFFYLRARNPFPRVPGEVYYKLQGQKYHTAGVVFTSEPDRRNKSWWCTLEWRPFLQSNTPSSKSAEGKPPASHGDFVVNFQVPYRDGRRLSDFAGKTFDAITLIRVDQMSALSGQVDLQSASPLQVTLLNFDAAEGRLYGRFSGSVLLQDQSGQHKTITQISEGAFDVPVLKSWGSLK